MQAAYLPDTAAAHREVASGLAYWGMYIGASVIYLTICPHPMFRASRRYWSVINYTGVLHTVLTVNAKQNYARICSIL